MGFGLKVKVEAPKVNVPKVDVAAEVKNVTGAVSGAVDSANASYGKTKFEKGPIWIRGE